MVPLARLIYHVLVCIKLEIVSPWDVVSCFWSCFLSICRSVPSSLAHGLFPVLSSSGQTPAVISASHWLPVESRWPESLWSSSGQQISSSCQSNWALSFRTDPTPNRNEPREPRPWGFLWHLRCVFLTFILSCMIFFKCIKVCFWLKHIHNLRFLIGGCGLMWVYDVCCIDMNFWGCFCSNFFKKTFVRFIISSVYPRGSHQSLYVHKASL